MSFPADLSPVLLKKALELGIEADDISEKFVTGGGSGGQKINKTSSCVMLKHLPTGTIVKCQKHREQSRNKLSAYKLLILKIEDEVKGKESDRAKKKFKIKKQKQKRSKRAKEKILHDKSHRATVKKLREPVPHDSNT